MSVNSVGHSMRVGPGRTSGTDLDTTVGQFREMCQQTVGSLTSQEEQALRQALSSNKKLPDELVRKLGTALVNVAVKPVFFLRPFQRAEFSISAGTRERLHKLLLSHSSDEAFADQVVRMSQSTLHEDA